MNNTTIFHRMLTTLLNLQSTGLYTTSFIYFGCTGSLHITIHEGNETVLPAPAAEWICTASENDAMRRVYAELEEFVSSSLGYTPVGPVDFPTPAALNTIIVNDISKAHGYHSGENHPQ